mmetsp:Transcript_31834/g.94801  ORF Transcript_31834/g.94801 Transcript_31834/m.94801 type:complete len:326 (-) Transcript_31834:1-978(-)
MEHHEHGRHVVAPDAVGRLQVGRDAPVQQVVHDAGRRLSSLQSLTYEVDCVLAADDVPDAVARDDQELVLGLAGELAHVRRGAHELLVGTPPRVGLVAEVAYGPGAAQAAVHPGDPDGPMLALRHEASRAHDALPLPRQGGLVVLGQRRCDAPSAEHRPAVASIRDDQHLGPHQADYGGTAAPGNRVREEIAIGVRVGEQHVHPLEGGNHGIRVALLRALRQLLGEVLAAEVGHGGTAVAVQDSERSAVDPGAPQAGGRKVRVLHGPAPALHAADAPLEAPPGGGAGVRLLRGDGQRGGEAHSTQRAGTGMVGADVGTADSPDEP